MKLLRQVRIAVNSQSVYNITFFISALSSPPPQKKKNAVDFLSSVCSREGGGVWVVTPGGTEIKPMSQFF